jgi:AcrR family transcriptional regulator
MLKLSRKQREIRQRGELILDVTRDLLLDLGYHGLTMERIAEAMEYSKGTIYQHFSCKEEVLMEVGLRIFQKQITLFDRAPAFEGRTRERMVAIGEAGEAFVRLYPDDFRILHIIRAEIITSKVSQECLTKMRDLERHLFSLMSGVVNEAMALGELALPAKRTVQELVFGLWALADGGYGTILRAIPMVETGIRDPFHSIMNVCDILGDGYGWRPLTSEWDYEATRARIRATLFAEELQEVGRRRDELAAV